MSTHFDFRANPGLVAYVGTAEQFPSDQNEFYFVGRIWNNSSAEFNINDYRTVEVVVRDQSGVVVNKRPPPLVTYPGMIRIGSEGSVGLSSKRDNGVGASLHRSAFNFSVPGVYHYEVTVWITPRGVSVGHEGHGISAGKSIFPYYGYGIPAGKGSFRIVPTGTSVPYDLVSIEVDGKVEEASKHLNKLFQPSVLWRSNADDFDENGFHWKPAANGQFVAAPTSELLREHQSTPAPVRSVSTSDSQSSQAVAAEPPSVLPLVLVLLGLLIVGVWIALRLKTLMNRKSQ
jgi:hypothetical protein